MSARRTPVRDLLLRWVLSGTSTVMAFQRACGIERVGSGQQPGNKAATQTPGDGKHNAGNVIIHNRLLHLYFLTSAAAGNELFYIVFFPFVFWCIDFAVCRRLIVLWVFVYWVGQSVKDIMRLPRPPSPPVTRLETHYETEYGFPSTHAMVSLVLPFYALMIYADMGYATNAWGVGAATLWCVSITLSRLYVGVHSVCDLTGGLLLGALVLAFGYACGPAIDVFVSTNPLSPLVALLVSYVLIWLYPAPLAWTNAYGDTSLIIATAAGILCGCASWLPKHSVPPMDTSGSDLWEQAHSVCATLMFKAFRMLIGCALLFLTRAVMKKVAVALWLPCVLPTYFAYCSTLPSPTHEEDTTAATFDVRMGEITDTAPTIEAAVADTDEAAAAVLHKRKQVGEAAGDVAASAVSAPVSDGESRLRSPQPLRPVAPAQFRLSALSSPRPSSAGLSIDPPVAPLTHLRELLRSPSPPHRLLPRDPSDPAAPLLAEFKLDGRDVIINPMQVYLLEIPVKYVTYFSVGFNAVATCPILFSWLGI